MTPNSPFSSVDKNVIGIGVIVLLVVFGLFMIYYVSQMGEQKKLTDTYKEQLEKELAELGPEATGGKTDKYEWNQTDEEVDVEIPLTKFDPTPTVREINVSFKGSALKVTVRREVYIEGEFFEKVKVDDCCWTLERTTDSVTLQLSLVKSVSADGKTHRYWPCVLKGDPMVNIPRGSLPSVETLDPSDPAAIKQAMKAVSTC
jgi:hypothetical protein